MRINQDDLNKSPELIGFIHKTNNHEQEQDGVITTKMEQNDPEIKCIPA